MEVPLFNRIYWAWAHLYLSSLNGAPLHEVLLSHLRGKEIGTDKVSMSQVPESSIAIIAGVWCHLRSLRGWNGGDCLNHKQRKELKAGETPGEGRPAFDAGSEELLERGNSKSGPVALPGNPMDRRLWATVHGVTRVGLDKDQTHTPNRIYSQHVFYQKTYTKYLLVTLFL